MVEVEYKSKFNIVKVPENKNLQRISTKEIFEGPEVYLPITMDVKDFEYIDIPVKEETIENIEK